MAGTSNNIDLLTFQTQVIDELADVETPPEVIAGRIWAHLSAPPPEIDTGHLLPGKHQRETVPAKEWQIRLKQDVVHTQMQLATDLVVMEPENHDWLKERDRIVSGQEATPEAVARLWQHRQEVSKAKAQRLIRNTRIQAALCHAIKQASDDVFEIAKIITPVLLGLAAAGTVTIPLVPALFAATAITIARMGIASLCADDVDKKNNKQQ